jgi:CRP/FNR family transcriptional regulator
MGLDNAAMAQLDQIIGQGRRVSQDKRLYRMGDSFKNLYAIRFGHFKTSQVNHNGEQQIIGFQMAGELLGMDGIGSGEHSCDAIALEDSEVCEIPFSRLETLFGHMPILLHHFHQVMSQEIIRDQGNMLMLGNMHAEQKFAAFLVSLSSRYAALGYSSNSFGLRMSRTDIGNYLGLTIESISRLTSHFRAHNLVTVEKRELHILDLAKLTEMALGGEVPRLSDKSKKGSKNISDATGNEDREKIVK